MKKRYRDRILRLLLAVVTVLLCLGLAELFLWLTIDWRIDYYGGSKNPGIHRFPFGEIRVNSLGFPDEEWDLTDRRPRIGYFGDSVVYGTGAGSGYRFPDLLKVAQPDSQHMLFARVATGMQEGDGDRIARIVSRFGLSTVVYVMNLNDVLPSVPRGGDPIRLAEGGIWGQVHFVMRSHFDGLTRKSYLYNFIRTKAKLILLKLGYDLIRYELFPVRHRAVFEQTVDRINRVAAQLKDRGVAFCVIVLPYEMQISGEAEEKYRTLGTKWEDRFIERGPQELILNLLDKSIPVVDAYYAFVDDKTSRADNRVGQYFVYNRGSMMDYNHPTREGHAKIAEYLNRLKTCP